ncbi:hypothetical protein PC128_g24382 [Phytophthora cactorum]|nr:hypothetical protein PC128_g24382 [Phytophthora cactorum]KAG4053231.1 hypothetical protein PC123_g11614 [Phytophthora cactorum]
MESVPSQSGKLATYLRPRKKWALRVVSVRGPRAEHCRRRGTSEQLVVSPIDVFGLHQERFIEEQKRTPWIQAMIAFLENGALALDRQIRTKTILMALNYDVRNGVLMR